MLEMFRILVYSKSGYMAYDGDGAWLINRMLRSTNNAFWCMKFIS